MIKEDFAEQGGAEFHSPERNRIFLSPAGTLIGYESISYVAQIECVLGEKSRDYRFRWREFSESERIGFVGRFSPEGHWCGNGSKGRDARKSLPDGLVPIIQCWFPHELNGLVIAFVRVGRAPTTMRERKSDPWIKFVTKLIDYE